MDTYLPTSVEDLVADILVFFECGHLDEKLQAVSRPFGALALELAGRAPNKLETVAGLRKLLEAKDCAVRAAL